MCRDVIVARISVREVVMRLCNRSSTAVFRSAVLGKATCLDNADAWRVRETSSGARGRASSRRSVFPGDVSRRQERRHQDRNVERNVRTNGCDSLSVRCSFGWCILYTTRRLKASATCSRHYQRRCAAFLPGVYDGFGVPRPCW